MLGCDFLAAFDIDIADEDMRALCGEELRNGGTEA